MAEASDTLGILRQNLLDAGCAKNTVAMCMELAQQDKWQKIPDILTRQKQALLNQVHNNQKQIDCLDFLFYQLQRKIEQEEKQ